SGSLVSANGDVLKANAAFREWFLAFVLKQTQHNGLRVVPIISVAALERMMGTPTAFQPGRVSALEYGPDGELEAVWGPNLGGGSSSTGYSAALEYRSVRCAWAR